MPHDIFISYSRRDLAAVKPIKEELESLGFSCWMDLEGIESGSEEFAEKIAEAIGDSTAVLFFISEASQNSRWSLNELRLARDQKKHVVLIRFDETKMSPKFKLEFGGTDIIDLRETEQKEKLLHDLRQWTEHPLKNDASNPSPVQLNFGETLAQHLDKWLPWQKFRCVAGVKFRNGDSNLTAHVVGSPWGIFLVGYDDGALIHVWESDFQVLANHLRTFADMIAGRCGLNRHRVHFLFSLPEEEFNNPSTTFPEWVFSTTGAVEYLKRFKLEIPVLDWEKNQREITKKLESLSMTHSGRESNILKHFNAGAEEELEDGVALLAWADNPSEKLLDAAEMACYQLRDVRNRRSAESIRAWFRVMSDRGDVLAMDHYGWLLEGGDEERVEWFRKAAELGGAHAQNSLGHCLHIGRGVRQDRDEALRWFRASANQGNRFGQASLAGAYIDPAFAGLVPNFDEAFRLYRLSAEQGWHMGQYHLGECYEKGIGTTPDLVEARRWYEKAAKQSNNMAQAALERLSEKEP